MGEGVKRQRETQTRGRHVLTSRYDGHLVILPSTVHVCVHECWREGGGGELSNIDKLMKLLIHSLLCTCMYICSENNILSNIAMRVRANY